MLKQNVLVRKKCVGNKTLLAGSKLDVKLKRTELNFELCINATTVYAIGKPLNKG